MSWINESEQTAWLQTTGQTLLSPFCGPCVHHVKNIVCVQWSLCTAGLVPGLWWRKAPGGWGEGWCLGEPCEGCGLEAWNTGKLGLAIGHQSARSTPACLGPWQAEPLRSSGLCGHVSLWSVDTATRNHLLVDFFVICSLKSLLNYFPEKITLFSVLKV